MNNPHQHKPVFIRNVPLLQAFTDGTSSVIQRPVMLTAVRYPHSPSAAAPRMGVVGAAPPPGTGVVGAATLPGTGAGVVLPLPARSVPFPGGMMVLNAVRPPPVASVPVRVDSDGAPLIYSSISAPSGGKQNSVSPPAVMKPAAPPVRNGVLHSNGHEVQKDPLAWDEQDDPLA